ncbi:olfactory receptor 5AP2-like [Rhinophrynus dorsalis]
MAEFVTYGNNVTDFLILGFSYSQGLKVPLCLLFLSIYLITILCNFMIIILVCIDRSLQKPMYFFLCNMSFLDIFYTSVTAPNLLHNIITDNKTISFKGCMTQLFFFNSFGSMEYMLLTSMAYDRYTAICNPLCYYMNMNRNNCQFLAGAAWTAGFLAATPISVLVSGLCYCSSNHINHFFCDITPLLKLACDDTSATEFVIFAEGILIVLNCFILTLTSYIYIISAILKIGTRESRQKTFSTCASHLTVVILFYTMIVCVYMKPTSSYSLDEGKVLSILYVNIVPMLNPVIYSLRNKDVKKALSNYIWCF